MKHESAQHLQKARQLSVLAHRLLRHTFVNDAARDAYLAAYHAAQAYIIASSGKAAPTHKEAHALFAELAAQEPRVGDGIKTFLTTTYLLKNAIDYDVTRTDEISPQQALSVVHGAEAFVKLIGSLLTHPSGSERERSGAPMA